MKIMGILIILSGVFILTFIEENNRDYMNCFYLFSGLFTLGGGVFTVINNK